VLLGGGVIAKYVAPPPAPGRLRSTLGVVAANTSSRDPAAPAQSECDRSDSPGQLAYQCTPGQLSAWFVETESMVCRAPWFVRPPVWAGRQPRTCAPWPGLPGAGCGCSILVSRAHRVAFSFEGVAAIMIMTLRLQFMH
jgi:hypothetical protein